MLDPHPQQSRGSRRMRRLAELRATWGQAVERERDFETIALYHRLSGNARNAVDGPTWQDLGMDEVFAAIDATVGMPGRQVLYHQLRTPDVSRATLAERGRQHEFFRREAAIRERIQMLMDALNGRGAPHLVLLVAGGPLPRPKGAWGIRLLSIVTPLSVVGLFVFHWLVFIALPLVLANAAISRLSGETIASYVSGFSQLCALLSVAKQLTKIEDARDLPQLAELRQAAPLIRKLHRRVGWLAIDRTALPELMEAVFGYINMLCLLDLVAYLRSAQIVEERQPELRGIFEAVGSLDAAIAVASYTSGLREWTTPEFVDEPALAAEGIAHPLIQNAVGNDITLHHRSMLITGPNMAGKTAFIRTIGVNAILGQTLFFCLARRAKLPGAVVRSAIRTDDSLSDGRSYFFTEINRVMEFTRPDVKGRLQLFLIDEIFRGTNTVERIASATAVLRYLARGSLVLATTHDVELQASLADGYAMYHFEDQIGDGVYGFNYRLCAGPVRSRNAIRLLEISGFPPEIIAEADRLANQSSISSPAAIDGTIQNQSEGVPT